MSPPRIMFDDGSRIMQEEEVTHDAPSSSPLLLLNDTKHRSKKSLTARNKSVPITTYYEIDRVAKEAVDKLDWSTNTRRGRLLRQFRSFCGKNIDNNNDNGEGDDTAKIIDDDGFLCRIALQFPDDLLPDAPEVSWLIEEAIIIAYKRKFMHGFDKQSNLIIRMDEDSTTTTTTTTTQSSTIIEQHVAQPPLVFILGDSSPSCCPDEVSANHLNANLIVHYGYACLSPSESIPVVYGFGVSQTTATTTTSSSATDDNNIGGVGDTKDDHSVWEKCAQLVTNSEWDNKKEDAVDYSSGSNDRKLLVVYDVIYHHAMNILKTEFDKFCQYQVVFASLPKQQLSVTGRLDTRKGGETCDNSQCCGGNDRSCDSSKSVTQCVQSSECSDAAKDVSSCCAKAADQKGYPPPASERSTLFPTVMTRQPHNIDKQYIPRTIGGLEIPEDLNLSQFTLLYIGDDLNIDLHDGNAQHRLLQILLRCNSPDGPKSIWSYSPEYRRLNTDVLNSPLSPTDSTTLSTVLSRMLRRRYFLLNKAKLATTIAILIGTTSNSYSFRRLLSRTRDRIQSTGRTAYTFAVGKLSTAGHKLANFAEIDCFVLISCGESITQFWQMERDDMIVPVLSPAELDVALGFREWDGRYSCDFGDLIRWDEADAHDNNCQPFDLRDTENKGVNERNHESSGDDDEPFFSMISGKYEHSKAITTMMNHSVDLGALPGQGILTEYRSEAAEFLNKREYRGLETNVGETKVQAAVLGKVGIASDYGESI